MSNNPYPVDSATRTCCGGIDKHAADCDPQIPLPVGATSDGWTSIRAYDGCPVRALVWWHRDLGRISVSIDGWQDATGTLDREISVYGIEEGDPITAVDARRIAAALIEAADELDRLDLADDMAAADDFAAKAELIVAAMKRAGVSTVGELFEKRSDDSHPVDPTGPLTVGSIPEDDLDGLIARTVPTEADE